MNDRYTVKQAAEYLGVTRQKIHQLLKDGELHPDKNPMDKREKLIPIAELDRLKQYLPATQEKPVMDMQETQPVPTQPQPKPKKVVTFTPQHKEIAKRLVSEISGVGNFGRVKYTMQNIPGYDTMGYEKLKQLVSEKLNKNGLE